jgi:hypothetical protein
VPKIFAMISVHKIITYNYEILGEGYVIHMEEHIHVQFCLEEREIEDSLCEARR